MILDHQTRKGTCVMAANYTIKDGAILCHACGLTSHNPNDVQNLFCGKCGKFHTKKKKYNHLFGLGFTVDSDNDGEAITADELLAAMERRVSYLRQHRGEILEACGFPEDTIENEE